MKWLIQVLFFISFKYSCSQNLVLNSSFEDTSSCPTSLGQIDKAIQWFSPTANTPDYFNACWEINGNSSVDVPDNMLGYQFARTGNGYAGVLVTDGFGGRDYIEGMLSDSLIEGKRYCIEFYVSLSDRSRLIVDQIGAYLSDSIITNFGTLSNLPFIPQVENPENNMLSDKENWILISGEFIAQGGEKYLTIGNFRTDSETNIDTLNIDTLPWVSYYYIDDVSIYCCDAGFAVADAGSDKAICNGDSITIGTPAISGCTYYWQPTEGISDTTNPQPKVMPQTTATYYLTVTDTTSSSCQYPAQDSITITVIDSFPFADAGNDIVICKEENAVIGSPAVNGYQYNWQPAIGLNNPAIAQPEASPTQTTLYILTVSIEQAFCTPAQDSVAVFVENCDTVKSGNLVFIPSVFSPNGDGNNDFFRVRGANITEGYLAVYNRWGEKVFELQFSQNDINDVTKWWDGTYNGMPLNTAVFVYFCKITYKDGKTEEMQGNITLVK